MAEGELIPSTPALKSSHSWGNVSIWPKALFVFGILIFLGNMAISWWLAIRANTFVSEPLVSDAGRDKTIAEAIKLVHGGDGNVHIFAQQLIGLDTTLRAISNRHVILIVAMASAFSFVAIGFALFVMGIESAFTLSAGDEKHGSVILKASAPGLACFLFATIIVTAAIMCQTSIDAGGIAAFDRSSSPPPSGGMDNSAGSGAATLPRIQKPLPSRTDEQEQIERESIINLDLKPK